MCCFIIGVKVLFASIAPVVSLPQSYDSFSMRVLLKRNVEHIALKSTSNQFSITYPDCILSEIKIEASFLNFYLFSPLSGTYFSQSPAIHSFSQAIAQADQIYQSICNTGLDIFISSTPNNTFFIEVGPFEQTTDARFFCSFMQSSGITFKVASFSNTQSFAYIEWGKESIYLRSALFDTNQDALPLFLIHQHSPSSTIAFENRDYPHQLICAYSPSQKLMLINKLPLEEYLRSVVPAEMPRSWNLEALKAQAVASRTYAVSRALQAQRNQQLFDVTNDTFTQVYLGKRYFAESDKAILSTKNQILTSNQRIIESVYHSTSGGHTEDNDSVWSGGPRPYLRGVSSKGEEGSPHFTWYKNYSIEDFIASINQYQLSRGREETLAGLSSSKIIENGSSPRVKKMMLIHDDEFIVLRGSELQSIFSLKSTWFDLLIWRPSENDQWWKNFMDTGSSPPEKVYIYGRGWGHGVGMSQHGALAQARRGATYDQILYHYYQGTNLVSVLSLPVASTLQFQPHQSCRLSFQPSYLKVEKDEEWSVQLHISSTASIQGFALDIVFDSQLINIKKEDVEEGTFLKAGDKTTIFLKNQEGSRIHVGLGREGDAGGVTGSGHLLTISGQTVKEGASSIKLENVHFFNHRLEEVAAQWDDVEVEVYQVDRVPPKTLITKYPPPYINQSFVSFQWTGSDDQTPTENLFYSYRLNDEEWSSFTRETSYTFHLPSDGVYVFSVKARDEAGNIDPHPPEYTFHLNTTPPKIHLEPYPSKTTLASIELKGRTGPHVTLLINAEQCEVYPDGSFSYPLVLNLGENHFRLIAIDQHSNTASKDILIIREEELETSITISLTIGSQKAIVNQHIKDLDAPPFIEQGRTFVPLRFIAESFEATVEWDAEEKKIYILFEQALFQRSIVLWIGLNKALVDNNIIELDVPPVIRPPGRTFVPIRFIAEKLGSKVTWHPQTQSVRIIFPDPDKSASSMRKLVKLHESS